MDGQFVPNLYVRVRMMNHWKMNPFATTLMACPHDVDLRIATMQCIMGFEQFSRHFWESDFILLYGVR